MRSAALILVALIAAGILGWLSGVVTRSAARASYREFLLNLHRNCHRPWQAVLFVAALLAALPFTDIPDRYLRGVRHTLWLALIGAVAWLVLKVLFVAEELAFRRFPVDIADNRRMRRARTQIGLLRRLTAVVVTMLALAAALMTFPQLRTVGTSLFASAGIAGIVVGLAAQSTLGNALAGLQLAFTDTLRIDDVVVVEGEWGHIEELQLTHVVVRVWDDRRLILPTTYFTTKPFQNWTRRESRVLGTVVLHLDHTMPIDELRAEAQRLAEKSLFWDKRVCVVQVTDTTETTMVTRVVVSAADGPTAWDLRCEIREGLIGFIQERYPECLPVTRTKLFSADQ